MNDCLQGAAQGSGAAPGRAPRAAEAGQRGFPAPRRPSVARSLTPVRPEAASHAEHRGARQADKAALLSEAAEAAAAARRAEAATRHAAEAARGAEDAAAVARADAAAARERAQAAEAAAGRLQRELRAAQDAAALAGAPPLACLRAGGAGDCLHAWHGSARRKHVCRPAARRRRGRQPGGGKWAQAQRARTGCTHLANLALARWRAAPAAPAAPAALVRP
jgi:hypothetical protein